MDYEKLGLFLCGIRQQRKLSRTAFARQLNIPASTYRRAEQGKGPLTLSEMRAICDSLQLSIDNIDEELSKIQTPGA